MKQSIVIELMGSFIGVAIADADSGYGFVAVDERLRDLARRRWRSLGSLRSAARRALQHRKAQEDEGRIASAISGYRCVSEDPTASATSNRFHADVAE